MVSVLPFLLAGIILILGFIGDYIFKKTSVPDILIMIFLGYMLGPVFNIINLADLAPITQVFATLALLVILFDSGLQLDLIKTLRNSPRAVIMAFTGMVFSMFLGAFFLVLVLNWSFIESLLMGAILGGTSSAVVIPLITRMNKPEKISTILSLESVFTDALVVVLGITLLQLLTGTVSGDALSIVMTGIASQFSIGIIVGLFLGIIWLSVLKIVRGSVYDDILTLAFVLLVYSIVDGLGGNGAIFAITFGLVLGNGYAISKMLRIKNPVQASKVMKKFQSQISFLLRTFFFVYLGLIISFQNFYMILAGIILSAILLFCRYSTVLIVSVREKLLKKNKMLLTIMLPRGLAAAVMAQIVASSTVPNGALFPDIVIAVIVVTVLISSIGPFLIGRKSKQGENSVGLRRRRARKVGRVRTKRRVLPYSFRK